MAGVDGGVEEEGCRIGELVCLLGSEVGAGGVSGERGGEVGMAAEIVLQRAGYYLALRHHIYRVGSDGREGGLNLRHQERIVGAAEHEGVYLRVLGEEQAEVFIHEIVGSVLQVLAVLYQRHPHGACLLHDTEVCALLLQLDDITAALDSPGCAEYAYMPVARAEGDLLCRGADDAENIPYLTI